MRPTTRDADPPPEPPTPPEPDACCGKGCTLCVFDLHELAMDRYRHALQAWRARHPEAPPADAEALLPRPHS